jgi:hypothetical protein
MDYGTVARSVKASNRFEVLSFTHHIQVAALRPARQKRFLTRALEKGWSVSELKKQIAADGGNNRDPGPRTNEETARKLGGKILEALRALPELESPNRKYLEDEDGLQLLREIVEEADRASAEVDKIASWVEGADEESND